METYLPIVLKGFLLGVMVAAPVGPIAILVFSRALRGGFMAGFSCALGVALVDGFFAAVAGFGIAAISELLLEYQTLVGVFGGGFLFYLGVKTVLKKEIAEPSEMAGKNLAKGFLKGVGLTITIGITNPLAILLFVSLFGTAGLSAAEAGYSAVGFLVTGVFLGTLSWKTSLSGVAAFMRSRVTPSVLYRMNLVSGIILMGFGGYFLVRMFI